MTRWVLPLALVVLSPVAWAQRPPAVVPGDPATVIEQLPHGYADLEPAGTGRSAGEREPSIERIRKLLATASRTGDARLAARADALLAGFRPDDDRADVLRTRAFSAQHRHDFAAALRLLDALVAKEPRDGDARLSRAQINLVQGRLKQARADCTALALGIDEGRGLLCIASLALRSGDFATAGSITGRWLAQAPADDPSRRYVLVMRAEIAWRSGDGDADGWFRKALALAPDDARTLLSYARFLRAGGHSAELESLLKGATGNDSLQLQRALAAHAAGIPQVHALVEAQGRRYAIAHEAGSQPELRDEADYLLTLRNQPDKALILAQRNFQTQRDYEDVDILQRAAVAAGRPQALQPLRDWAKSQGLTLPEAGQ